MNPEEVGQNNVIITPSPPPFLNEKTETQGGEMSCFGSVPLTVAHKRVLAPELFIIHRNALFFSRGYHANPCLFTSVFMLNKYLFHFHFGPGPVLRL